MELSLALIILLLMYVVYAAAEYPCHYGNLKVSRMISLLTTLLETDILPVNFQEFDLRHFRKVKQLRSLINQFKGVSFSFGKIKSQESLRTQNKGCYVIPVLDDPNLVVVGEISHCMLWFLRRKLPLEVLLYL